MCLPLLWGIIIVAIRESNELMHVMYFVQNLAISKYIIKCWLLLIAECICVNPNITQPLLPWSFRNELATYFVLLDLGEDQFNRKWREHKTTLESQAL